MIKVVAVLCKLLNPSICHEQLVTNSDIEPNLTMTDCMVGMPKLAERMKAYPQYRLAKLRCSIGEPAKEGA